MWPHRRSCRSRIVAATDAESPPVQLSQPNGINGAQLLLAHRLQQGLGVAVWRSRPVFCNFAGADNHCALPYFSQVAFVNTRHCFGATIEGLQARHHRQSFIAALCLRKLFVLLVYLKNKYWGAERTRTHSLQNYSDNPMPPECAAGIVQVRTREDVSNE